MTLSDRVLELCEQHGSLRAAARVIQIDAGYLSRLLSGEKVKPGPAILKRMGIKQVVSYQRIGPKGNP